jgi:hypothetical protein
MAKQKLNLKVFREKNSDSLKTLKREKYARKNFLNQKHLVFVRTEEEQGSQDTQGSKDAKNQNKAIGEHDSLKKIISISLDRRQGT